MLVDIQQEDILFSDVHISSIVANTGSALVTLFNTAMKKYEKEIFLFSNVFNFKAYVT